MPRPAVFLDRDGTLNVEKEYLYRIQDWEWIPGATDALRLINQMGYLAVVVTNQAGVARGYYSESDIVILHNYVDRMLAEMGARIDAYYYCPHHPEHGEVRDCPCRKPQPGMLFRAQRELDIDLEKSWLIGDKLSDVDAARQAGVSPVLVLTGYGELQREYTGAEVQCESDLLAAISYISKVETVNRKIS